MVCRSTYEHTVQRLEILTHIVGDNLNVGVMKFGNRLVAISEEAGEVELDQENLDTLGSLAFVLVLDAKTMKPLARAKARTFLPCMTYEKITQ